MMKITTTPYHDQRPGTSGLRKPVSVFKQKHYLENFIQATFNSLNDDFDRPLVIGGDGRYYNNEAIQIILSMAAANGVKQVLVAKDGLLSTPAASNIIRQYHAIGGFILSASHNPAGPEGDFGIKYNISNGGPAPEAITDTIYQYTQTIDAFYIIDNPPILLSTIGESRLDNMVVKVIDGIADYLVLMQQLFDFTLIRQLIEQGFHFCFDAMHAVTGPYAKQLFQQTMAAPKDSLINCIPLADFGAGHPDPNLTYAKDLVTRLYQDNGPEFGAASDGDGDRNMILGRQCFVSPSDSLAIIAANIHLIPGYRHQLRGVARSMPTSRAIDVVAKKLAIPCYETPTGWKFFGNLLDAEMVTLCGEESFGTGSHHIREKDGLWAVLCWLNIIAARQQSVATILHQHWQEFGRHYYTRHDYEAIDKDKGTQLLAELSKQADMLIGKRFHHRKVVTAQQFCYQDPVDNSLSENQGFCITFSDDARLIYRLSGTGTQGATLRVYIESYVTEPEQLYLETQSALADLVHLADNIANVRQLTGRTTPTVIT